MDYSEAVGQLMIARGNGPIDLEMIGYALAAVALLVERAVILDLQAAV